MKKYLKQLKANKKGFTLIEMIVVIAIIGILAAILVPSMAGYLSNARDSKKEANAKTVYTVAQAAVTSLESTNILPTAQAKYDKNDATAKGEDPIDKLFDEIEELLGAPNYSKFEEIVVQVKDGAVEGVSVKEKGETDSITYPKGFELAS